MDLVRLKCVLEGRKLRIKIISHGYSPHCNCRFPRDIRLANREYLVPAQDITLCDTRCKFFYSVAKRNIQIIGEDGGNMPSGLVITDAIKNMKIYADDDNPSCAICFDDECELVIFAPCGHSYTCSPCANKLKKICPICRKSISMIVTKDQLQ